MIKFFLILHCLFQTLAVPVKDNGKNVIFKRDCIFCSDPYGPQMNKTVRTPKYNPQMPSWKRDPIQNVSITNGDQGTVFFNSCIFI
jgi:hypothetical protein